jgi:hypothetical protein
MPARENLIFWAHHFWIVGLVVLLDNLSKVVTVVL